MFLWYNVDMWLEGFVISMCLSGYECDNAPRAYYLQNKELQQLVQRTENKAKDIAGPFVTEYLIPYSMPYFLIVTGQKGTIKITRNVSFTGGPNEGKINLQWEF